jgi:cobalt-zinc-cadmium efflux system outer membrane protein
MFFLSFGACALGLTIGGLTADAQDALRPGAEKSAELRVAREAMVRWALENNPEMAAIRQQRGIAAAGVVLAATYPFNPVFESRVEGASGPESAGITNVVLNEHKVLLELELHGQRDYREQAAAAAMTRTEWEVAFQEIQLATRVLRAFDGVLYRIEKLRLADERIRLNESAANQILKLREQGKLSPADLILILTEVDDSKAQRGASDLALVTAEYELRRAAGAVGEPFEPEGSLERTAPLVDQDALMSAALERRPDLRAKQAAIAEAEAKVRLETSNRYGNPTLGPSYGLDPTRVSSLGVTLIVPLPTFNTHRGEILQRQAEQARAVLELQQVNVQVQQDVQSAVARLRRAKTLVESYEKQVLPNLRKSLEAVEKLFAQGEPGVDVVRVLEIRRNLLRGRDAYLDALWEQAQAEADLVGAVGDLAMVFGQSGSPRSPQQ